MEILALSLDLPVTDFSYRVVFECLSPGTVLFTSCRKSSSFWSKLKSKAMFPVYYMACLNERARWTKFCALIGCANGQDPLKITCCVFFIPYNNSFIDQACSVNLPKLKTHWSKLYTAADEWDEEKAPLSFSALIHLPSLRWRVKRPVPICLLKKIRSLL